MCWRVQAVGQRWHAKDLHCPFLENMPNSDRCKCESQHSTCAAAIKPSCTCSQIWFVSFYGALGFISPYFNLILQQYGYQGWQLGIVSAVRPFVAAACGPLWAAFADKHSMHRRIFLTTLIATTVVRHTFSNIHDA